MCSGFTDICVCQYSANDWMCGSTGTKKTDQRIRVDEKMTLNKILIIGLLLIIVTAMPVMAQLNITHMGDGKTLFTNGS